MNGDGFADVIVGASGANEGGADRGAAYVVSGFGTADVVVAANGKSATFTDWDGDLVKIKSTKGPLTSVIKALNFDGVSVLASGFGNPGTPAAAVAIKSITIGGSVSASEILAGYDATGAPVNADVAIGKVFVKGQWIASDLAGGVRAGTDGIFATADDALIGGGNAIVAKIASITVSGAAFGTNGNLRDGFGFAAEEIGSLKIGKAKVPLQKLARNDTTAQLVGVTGDVRVREVA